MSGLGNTSSFRTTTTKQKKIMRCKREEKKRLLILSYNNDIIFVFIIIIIIFYHHQFIKILNRLPLSNNNKYKKKNPEFGSMCSFDLKFSSLSLSQPYTLSHSPTLAYFDFQFTVRLFVGKCKYIIICGEDNIFSHFSKYRFFFFCRSDIQRKLLGIWI